MAFVLLPLVSGCLVEEPLDLAALEPTLGTERHPFRITSENDSFAVRGEGVVEVFVRISSGFRLVSATNHAILVRGIDDDKGCGDEPRDIQFVSPWVAHSGDRSPRRGVYRLIVETGMEEPTRLMFATNSDQPQEDGYAVEFLPYPPEDAVVLNGTPVAVTFEVLQPVTLDSPWPGFARNFQREFRLVNAGMMFGQFSLEGFWPGGMDVNTYVESGDGSRDWCAYDSTRDFASLNGQRFELAVATHLESGDYAWVGQAQGVGWGDVDATGVLVTFRDAIVAS